MNYSFWEMLAETPWWVYVLFIYLLRLGFLATKDQVIPIKNLVIFPCLLILFSIYSSYSMMQWNFNNTFSWIAALVVGSFLGWLQFRRLKVKAIKNSNSLYIPGTWSLLIIILVLFSLKYYLGYEIAIDSQLFKDPKYAFSLSLFFGFFTGLFIGRLICAWRCLKVGPFISDIA